MFTPEAKLLHVKAGIYSYKFEGRGHKERTYMCHHLLYCTSSAFWCLLLARSNLHSYTRARYQTVKAILWLTIDVVVKKKSNTFHYYFSYLRKRNVYCHNFQKWWAFSIWFQKLAAFNLVYLENLLKKNSILTGLNAAQAQLRCRVVHVKQVFLLYWVDKLFSSKIGIYSNPIIL